MQYPEATYVTGHQGAALAMIDAQTLIAEPDASDAELRLWTALRFSFLVLNQSEEVLP